MTDAKKTDAQKPESEDWTIGRLLTWTTDYLCEHGSDSPRLDAEVLLAHARGCQRIELYTAFNEVPSEEVRTAFREMIRRRAAAMPVAYLVGHKEFYSLDFRVTSDVLIPRPETELLVMTLLDKAKELAATAGSDREVRIVDVGTGSGILAVSAAKHLPHSQVTAVDISSKALAIARENAQTHRLQERIAFHEGDLLAGLPLDAMFDFVVSNPPYVSEAEFAELADDVREHEPSLALKAGPDGTDVIARLIPQAAERLHAGGWLLMEISPMIADQVQALFRDDGRFAEPSVIRDTNRHARVIAAARVP